MPLAKKQKNTNGVARHNRDASLRKKKKTRRAKTVTSQKHH
jgi:uncharacterized protein YigA (DUF484 family)